MSKGKHLRSAHDAADAGRGGAVYQSAAVQIEFGKTGRLAARIDVTAGGLVAIGGMVAAMLLASAEIVRAARRR